MDPFGPPVWGRPVGVAIATDGSLLITDEPGGIIWRIRYQTPSSISAKKDARVENILISAEKDSNYGIMSIENASFLTYSVF